MLSQESTPEIAKQAYFQQKIVSDESIRVISQWFDKNDKVVLSVIASIEPKAKIDASELTVLIERATFIQRIECGDFDSLSPAIVDALKLQVITSDLALEWAIKLHDVSGDTFKTLIQDGEEKPPYAFERAFYEFESNAKTEEVNTQAGIDFSGVFDQLSFDVSDSMLETCSQNLSMAFGIVLDEEVNAHVDEMILISSIIGRIESIGVSAVESFTERASAIRFVRESLPVNQPKSTTPTKTQQTKKSKKKQKTLRLMMKKFFFFYSRR